MSTAVDVEAVIDRNAISASQYVVFALCFGVIFTDGFDIQAISYIAPLISKDWGLGRGVLGPVFSAGLFGLMLGSLFIGPLADRFGRRPVIIISTLAFGLLSVATIGARSVESLIALRFLTGLGLGGALPNAIALTSEYSPARLRGRITMVVISGISLGSITSGLLAARLAEQFGWQSVFVLGGVLPLLLTPILALAIPESIHFSAQANRGHNKALAALQRIDRQSLVNDESTLALREQKTRQMVASLLAPGTARNTLLLWCAYLFTMISLYLIVSWLPTMLSATGFNIQQATVITALFHVGGLVGSFTLCSFIDRAGPRRILVIAYLVAAVGIIAFGAARGLTEIGAILILAAVGFGVIGAQIGLGSLASLLYPTSIRSTGVGWGLGIGRVGSIIGPVVGGLLLALDMHPNAIFMLCAGPIMVAGLAASFIRVGPGPTAPAAVAPPTSVKIERRHTGTYSMDGMS